MSEDVDEGMLIVSNISLAHSSSVFPQTIISNSFDNVASFKTKVPVIVTIESSLVLVITPLLLTMFSSLDSHDTALRCSVYRKLTVARISCGQMSKHLIGSLCGEGVGQRCL